MKYLIFIFLLSGCVESTKPNPAIWQVRNDCKRLNELLKGSYFTLYEKDSPYHGGPIVVCSTHAQDNGYAKYYGLEAEGAVRGIIDYHNLPLKEDLGKCLDENECHKLKFQYHVECRHKCQDKVGWLR